MSNDIFRINSKRNNNMAEYKGREVSVLRDEVNPTPDKVLVDTKDLGQQIVNKADVTFTKEERDAHVAAKQKKLDEMKKRYADLDKAEADKVKQDAKEAPKATA